MPTTLPASPSPSPSLAERRRVTTRLEIARTAVRLITAHGYDGVTVEALAEAAGISARTFYRYFPVKEDVVVPLICNATNELAGQLAERPAHEPLTAAIPAALAAAVSLPGSLPPRESASFTRLLMTHTLLRGRWLDTLQDCEGTLAPVIAARLGLSADGVEAKSVSVAVMCALRVGMEHWAETGGDGDLSAAVAESLEFFASGAMLRA